VKRLVSVLVGGPIVCAAFVTQAQALVGTLRDGRLARLDARTLAPLPSPRPLRFRLPSHGPLHWVLSPDGSRVAVVRATSPVFVVDARRFRDVGGARNDGFDASRQLAWPSKSFLVAIGVGNRFPYEYTTIYPTSGSSSTIDADGEPVSESREGVVVEYNANEAEIFGALQTPIDLPGFPSNSPYPHAFAPDPRHDRLFVISRAGIVAEVDLAPVTIGLLPNVSYHQVALSTWPVQAAWAGNGQIAVWGTGGLARIDTGDWSIHPMDSDVTNVVATRHGLVTWKRGGSGLAVYGPGGALRFRLLRGRAVGSVTSLGPYAYVNTGDGRFSVNLREGHITGPLKSRARPILPDLVGIQ